MYNLGLTSVALVVVVLFGLPDLLGCLLGELGLASLLVLSASGSPGLLVAVGSALSIGHTAYLGYVSDLLAFRALQHQLQRYAKKRDQTLGPIRGLPTS